MYCIITTCLVECYWHCSEETVHYKSDEMVNFCGFRCATTSPITVFINFVFYIYSNIYSTNFGKQTAAMCIISESTEPMLQCSDILQATAFEANANKFCLYEPSSRMRKH